MRKILIICTTSEGGGGPEHVWNLIRGLDKKKFEVVLVAPNNGPYFQRFRDTTGVEVIDLPIRSANPKLVYDLWKLGRARRVDLVHSHGKGAGIYSRPVALLLGKPVVHTLHGIHFQTYGPISRELYLVLETVLGILTAKFINVSAGERDLAVKLGFYKPEKSVVIYNGVRLPDPKNRDALRQKMGLSGRILVNLARFNHQKGHRYLISAMPKVVESFPDVKLIMLGDGELIGDMRKLATERHVEDNCVFAGYKLNAIDYLLAADVCVSSSLWEGLPISLLEALSAKLPVVATDVVGNNEIIEDRRTGLLARPEDSADLSEKIILMLKDKSLRDKLSVQGYELIKEKFSLDEMIRKTEGVYGAILNENTN